MNPLFVAGIWLSLGALVSLLAGSGIGKGRRSRRGAPAVGAGEVREETRPLDPRPKTYVSPSAVEWGIAAHRVGTDMLLATRPGAIRRVPAPRPE